LGAGVGMIRGMTDGHLDPLAHRLGLLATNLLLGTAPVTDDAVDLACDLLVAGLDTLSTAEVAGLSRNVPLSESEGLVRSMLDEQGVELPAGAEHDRYATVRRAFAYWGLPLDDFEGAFYERLPAWDQQGPLDRVLVVMLDRRDHEFDPVRRVEIEGQMREEIRKAESQSAG
jgi:hypothetical protein